MGANDRIVVGVDGSAGSARALTWAAEVASARGWRLEAVMVWDLLDQHRIGGDERFDPHYDERKALAALRDVVDDALGERADEVVQRAVLDLPARGLLEAARGAALVVVGARGLGGFKGLLLGSVSQHVLHHATSPVAVVREQSAGTGASVVVAGVDGSENGAAALRWAIGHAGATGASLRALHVWHPAPFAGEPWVSSPTVLADWRAAGQAELDQALAGVDAGGVAVEPELVEGVAAQALIDASASASLVVVGSRGRGGFAELLLGSVAAQVARHAHCPVVVVPLARRG